MNKNISASFYPIFMVPCSCKLTFGLDKSFDKFVNNFNRHKVLIFVNNPA